jgi:hypothetical protein
MEVILLAFSNDNECNGLHFAIHQNIMIVYRGALQKTQSTVSRLNCQ